jgi:hypothetical protein
VVVRNVTAVALFIGSLVAFGQDAATLTVTVVDPSAAVVPGAKITLTESQRGIVTKGETNETGFVIFNLLQPGDYLLEAESTGFEKYVDHLTLQVRDRKTFRVELKVGASSGTTVEVVSTAQALSNDAVQGVTLDRSYIQNLPVNGRSVESLLLLAPGISTPAGGRGDGGYNANGLLSNMNYYMLDGVSVNQPTSGGGFAGGFGGGGGFQGAPIAGAGSSTQMIPIDAMQEMKVQTSSIAPEFGRSPGAQVVMTSRSGGNIVHGALYYYKRNDSFDANDWFANAGGLGKVKERQDRPGGVLGAPIVKNKTFIFVSFEKLKLWAPQSIVTSVPDLTTRAAAPAALIPYLKAFPLPNGSVLGGDAAEYRAIVSNPANSSFASVRIDHTLTPNTTLFVRYSLTPSNSDQRASGLSTPNIIRFQSSRAEVATAGVTHVFSDGSINDLRVNYSDSTASGSTARDNFGGTTPIADSQVFPAGITSANGSFSLNILGVGGYAFGGQTVNEQQQVNVVDSFTKVVRGNHHFKAGLDYRQLRQTNQRSPYSQNVSFDGLTGFSESFLTGVALNTQVTSNIGTVYPNYQNLSLYGQDTWRATDRTTVTYGLRWDLNPAPTTRQGPKPFALSSDPIAGVTQNEPIYATKWFNVAPRVGVAYLSDDTPGREMVLRAGVGFFYDLGYGVVDSAFAGAPYSNVRTISEVNFPLPVADLVAPSLPPTRPYGEITTGETGLVSPRVLEINGTWEKNFGSGTTLSIGASATRGKNLIRIQTVPSNGTSSAYQILRTVTNGASSTYDGLQVQFRKRLSSNFQTQVSYTWSHSIDSASSDSNFGGGFASLFGAGDKGSSDYDVRHSLSFSGTYRLPAPKGTFFYLLRDWYVDLLGTARSGLPFDIEAVSTCTSGTTNSTTSTATATCNSSTNNNSTNLFAQVRPSVTYTYSLYSVWIADPNVPGGQRLNKSVFTIPTGYAQGNLGRNALRGFSLVQVDFALRRMIPISERFQLNLAAEGYNILNHPNFANPSPLEGGNYSSPNFGVMTQMVSQSFAGGVNGLYRQGGPRSMELSVRLQF